MNVYLIVILAYFTLVTLISVLTRKVASRSAADFLIAGRNLGLIACAVVVAAEWLGGMSTIGVSEQAFTTGTLQPILYNISTAVGMIIIGFTVAKHYREKNVHTVSEMLEHLFGSKARFYSAIAFTLAYITLAYVQLQTCASVIAPLFGISWMNAVLISSVFITIYTYIGGMHAIAITGMIHVFTMFTGIGIALWVGLDKIDGLSALSSRMIELGSPHNFYNPFSAGYVYALSLILGGVLGGMAGQASIQPIFAARDAKTARNAAILSAFIVAPFGIMIALLGLIAKTGMFFDTTTITNPKMVLPFLMTTPEFIHPVLGGLALSGILAAILSTVGPVNFAIVTIVTKDIYHGIINKEAADKNIVDTARRLVLLVNIITIPLAIFIHGAILEAAYVSYAIRSIGAIVIILGIYFRKRISAEAVWFAFTAGTLAIGATIIAKQLHWINLNETLVSITVAIIFIVIGNLYRKMKDKK
ncbi:MAG: sodium:solute symporter family protein [Bacteroidales bacterium]|jgi:SSS family solute:Na+ symporter|nr:sodium:solute symporter family protein [Bacteroidales bacterium]